MSGSGMVSFAGGQYITTTISDSLWKTVALFGFMTVMGVVSKFVVSKVVVKKEDK